MNTLNTLPPESVNTLNTLPPENVNTLNTLIGRKFLTSFSKMGG